MTTKMFLLSHLWDRDLDFENQYLQNNIFETYSK